MKNYIVKAIRNFNDVVEKNEYGLDTPRKAEQSIWNCTKERYEFLKENNAVVLVGIDEIKEEKKDIIETEFDIRSKEVKKLVDEKTEGLNNIKENVIGTPKRATKKKTSKK